MHGDRDMIMEIGKMEFLTEEYNYQYLQKTLVYIAVYEAAFSMPDMYMVEACTLIYTTFHGVSISQAC